MNLSDANYTTEINIFNNSVNAMLDYDGSKKDCKFSSYNLRVNIFAGNSGNWSTFLWPHAYSSNALILMMQRKQWQDISSSTLCHEMLHTFGVGDLYAYTGASQNFSCQNLDMMASSSKNVSTNAYFREKIGWIKSSDYTDSENTPIEEITTNSDVTLDLYNNTTSDYSKTIAYKFGVNKNNKEFFVIEYKIRRFESKWDTIISKSAVVIYRVNPSVRGNSNANSGNYLNEIIFMGDSSIDVANYSYKQRK